MLSPECIIPLMAMMEWPDWHSFCCSNKSLHRYTATKGRWHLQLPYTTRSMLQTLDTLPPAVYGITIPFSGDSKVTIPVRFPDTLRVVTIQGRQKIELMSWKLPSFLVELHFSGEFNQPLEFLDLPITLRYLKIGSSFGLFNQPLRKLRCPAGLRVLKINGAFNQPLSRWKLPQGLRSLSIKGLFNHPVQGWKLPGKLVYLCIKGELNQPVQGWSLPQSLRVLKLRGRFNHPLAGWELPKALVHLEIRVGADFAHSLVQWTLPKNLRVLKLFNCAENIVGCTLPSNLQHLTVNGYITSSMSNWMLPFSLCSLCISADSSVPKLPPGLKHLWLKCKAKVSLEHFPDGLETLILDKYAGPCFKMPHSLERLMLKFSGDKCPPIEVPGRVRLLALYGICTAPSVSLPKSLQQLFLLSFKDVPAIFVIPSTIKVETGNWHPPPKKFWNTAAMGTSTDGLPRFLINSEWTSK